MENFTPEQKQPVLKSLALAGLVALLIFSAWAAIQIISMLPTAATSLASLASSVYNYNPNQSEELTVTSNQTLANVNEPIVLSWPQLDIPGSYIFSFDCADGVTLSLSTAVKNFSDMTCNTSYDLGSVNTASIAVSSTTERFTDISYTLAFYRTNATNASAAHDATLTVVNAAISTSTVAVVTPPVEVPAPALPTPEILATSTEVVVSTSTPAEEPVKATTTPSVVETPKPTPKPQPAPVFVPVYTYAIPVSNPNGTIDLALSNLGLGTVNQADQFIKNSYLRRGQAGALQFAVHNIGSKTSAAWTVTVLLPGDILYTSPAQTPLKPNERAVLTVEFPGVTSGASVTYAVTVESKDETQLQNNNFVEIAAVY